MSAGTDRPNGVHDEPSTPPEAMEIMSSQLSLPSTEGPPSPLDPASSFKTELNDDRVASPLIVPSSLTPPPSSQTAQSNGTAGLPLGYMSSQRSSMFSPPATTVASRRDGQPAPTAFTVPTVDQIQDASADELRRMLQGSLAENARLKMETAHHKLQYNLLNMQADEEAKRAAVEHEMTRKEVEVLRVAENARQNRRDLNAAVEDTQVKYIQLKTSYDLVLNEIKSVRKREKKFKKVLQQKEDEILSLTDERELLMRRIRENREHFHMLCSPGGAFHGALTPKLPTVATPQQQRVTPRQTPRSHGQEGEHGNQIGFQVLIEALNHDNNSAPSTPTSGHRLVSRMVPKHTRGAQSMSSLPTTPIPRPRGEHSTLLPSLDLIPRTEPAPRYANTTQFVPEAQSARRRKSRESTISADDNEELARAALNMAAVNQSMISHASQASAHRSQRRDGEGEEVYESQASQAASEMLRRDPRQSFDEVASSVNSRDATPAPAERSAKLQAKLFAPLHKAGLAAEKRKYSGQAEYMDARLETLASPTKKLRVAPSSAEARRVGLGIQYSQ